jgi:hypothetical protein
VTPNIEFHRSGHKAGTVYRRSSSALKAAIIADGLVTIDCSSCLAFDTAQAEVSNCAVVDFGNSSRQPLLRPLH